MSGRRKKLKNKYVYLPMGVHLAKGGKYFRVRYDGDNEKYFRADTETGLKEAVAFNELVRRERKEYGHRFGALSDAEKRAVDLWRAYRSECQKEASSFVSIEEVMQKGLEQVRPQSITPLFSELAKEYLLMMERKETSPEHLRKRADKIRRFCEHFQDVRAGNITPEAVQIFLDTLQGKNGGRPSPRTVQDYMVCLSHIYRYGIKRGMVQKNPLDAMDKPQVKPEGEPATISTETAQKILSFACYDLSSRPYLPGLLLAVFCGVRPAELARLTYKDLFPGGRPEVYLSRTLTKTNIDRRAKIRPNLSAWLAYTEQCGLHGAPDDYILPGNSEKQRGEGYTRNLKRLAVGAGVTIPRDSLRHTAATMICALDGMAEAAEELGNDVRTLQKHYRRAVTKDDAVSFFSIMPPAH